jgi:hypothetical protein
VSAAKTPAPRSDGMLAVPRTQAEWCTKAATIIGAGEASGQLANNLAVFCYTLKGEAREADKTLTRNELRYSLETVAAAVTQIEINLAKTMVLDALFGVSGAQPFDPRALKADLQRLRKWSEVASKPIPFGSAGGAGASLNENELKPETYCALVVGAAWRESHGKYPGAGNQKAHDAAKALWKAATGNEAKIDDWRARFNKALAFAKSAESDSGAAGAFLKNMKANIGLNMPVSQSRN